MRPQSQALKRNPWARVKDFLQHLRRSLSLKQIALFVVVLLAIFGLFQYFSYNAKKIRLENEQKVAILMQKRAEEAEQEEIKELVIPKNPYRFYDELEERSFYSLGEEEEGGVEREIVLPKPTFSLISESEESLDALIESVNAEKSEQAKTVQEETPIAPPVRAPIELLSAIEDEQAEEIEQGSSAHDVISEPLAIHQPSVTEAPKTAQPRESNQPNFRKLQTGSFLSLAEANIQRKQLEAYGYNPQIIRAEKAGKPIYRVHIGPFAISELQSIKRDLREKRFDFFEIR